MNRSLFEIYLNELSLPCDKYVSYFPIYEQYFNRFKNTDLTFIEVGVQGGGSLQMWRKYFGNQAKIIGIDINDLKTFNPTKENVILLLGDQSDKNFWDSVLPGIGKIDVFLDDGSHQMNDQITTMKIIWPHLSVGGVYIVEDTHTSYYKEWCGNGLQEPHTFIEFSKKLSDLVNTDHWQGTISEEMIGLKNQFNNLASVHYCNSMAIFTKGQPKWLRPSPFYPGNIQK